MAPAALFAAALAAMSKQSAPAALNYDETFTPSGLGLRLMNVGGVTVVHIVYSKDKTVRAFHISENSSQSSVHVTDAASGAQYDAATPFWSASWSSPQQAVPTGQSTVVSDTRDRMVADLTDDGAAYAPSLIDTETVGGFAVYHLHLSAQDTAVHPLTDLYVDEQTFLVRRAVAAFKDTSVTDVTGSITLNFAQVQNYWLVTSGEVDATVHAFLAQVSGSATFAATHVVVAAP